MSYLGTFKIDDYVPIPAACHRFSTGAAYAPTVLTYSIYEEGSATGLDEDVDMTPASPFDSIVGFYYARRQLTAAAGFEVGKAYVVVVKATVDSVAAIQWHTFQVGAAVDARYYAGTATVAGAIPAVAAGGSGGLLISGSNAGTTTLGAMTVTGATTMSGGLAVTGALTVSDGVAVTCSTAGRAAIKATGNGAGAGMELVAGSGNALTVGVANIGNTTVGTLTTGAVTLASEAITGAFSVGTTTTLTGAVSAPAGIAANITGNLVGTVSTVTTLTGHTAQTGDCFALIGTAGAGLTNINLPDQTMNITGNLSGSVGSCASATVTSIGDNVITAASIANGAIDAATFAADAITATVIANGAIDAATFAAGAITAAAIADGAIDNATFAADVGSTAYATNIIALAADKALVQQNLDHLVKSAVDTNFATTVQTDSVIGNLAQAAAGSFDRSTDSLESIVANSATVAGVAAAILATPANLLATDASGNVTLKSGTHTGAVVPTVSSVTAVATGGITAASFAANAIDATAIADNAIDAGAIATGAITSAKFAAGAIDATAIADNAIDAGALAADCITAAKIANGAIDANTLASEVYDAISDGVWNEDVVTAHTSANAAGRCIATLDAISDRTYNSNLNSLLGVPDSTGVNLVDSVWEEDIVSAHTTANASGRCLATLDGVSDRANNANVNAMLGVPDTAGLTLVDQVWDEAISGHTVVGSTGDKLSDAASGGDPWGTDLSIGGYTGEQAGKVVYDALNTMTPQTGDAYLRLGAPAGASVSADILAVKGDTAAVLLDTGTDGVVVAAASKTGYSIATNGITAASFTAGSIDATAIANGAIDAATFADNAVSAAALATDAVNEIVDQVWNEALTDHTASGSFGQRFQIVRTGTAQAGAAGSITLDASASAVDEFYNNCMIHVVGGTGVGQVRKVSTYNGTSKVASVSTNWVTNPSSDSVFVIYPLTVESGTGATAQQVWEYGTRDLTVKTGFALADATSDAVIADAVWNAAKASYGTADTYGDLLETALPDLAPGAAGGLMISGSNTGTTTLGALSITGELDAGSILVDGTTTLTGATALSGGLAVTGALTVSDGVAVTCSTAGRAAIKATGNAAGAGLELVAGSGNALTVGVTNIGATTIGNTTIGTIGTGAVTKASEAITGALTIGDGVAITCSTTGKAALKATGNGAGAGMELVAGSGNALTVGVANIGATTVGNTTIGTIGTGAVTKASETITGQLLAGTMSVTGALDAGSVLVDGTTVLTGTVSAPAGITAVLSNVTSVAGLGTGAIATTSFAAGAIDAAAIGTGAIDADAIAADAIGSSELAATAATEIAAATWNALRADYGTVNTFGEGITKVIGSRIRKNVSLNNFEFIMTDATTHAPRAGVTVVAQRSIDGGAYASCANPVSEVTGGSYGTYKINLAASDLNGSVITLRFTCASPACDDRLITIVTQE